MELLAPAGSPNALRAAIYSGANAVYFGLDKFNARINADNFTKENVREYVELCHLHGVKVYATFNTLIKDAEFKEFEEDVKACVDAKVDAFIVTDLGALTVFAKYDVPLHASTQMGIHNLDGARFVEKLGFKRVVLSRETLFDDIKKIKENTSLEIEYFVHGALCVSFSGGCLLSSVLTGTSGNRGLCKQPCRLCYESSLSGENKYYLSPADQCLINKLKDLEKLGIDSIKVEGRLKSAHYVGEVVKSYRQALDGKLDSNYMSTLYRAYNRGHFTAGYNYDDTNNLMSIDIQNSIGEKVGEILNRKGATYTISSNYEFKIGDGVKVVKDNKELGGFGIDNVEKKDGLFLIKNNKNYPIGSSIHLTHENEIAKKYENVDLALPAKVNCAIDKAVKFVVECNGIKVEKEYDIVSKAQNRAVTEADILEKIKGNDFFKVQATAKVQDGLFVPMSKFNEARREVLDELKNKCIDSYEKNMLHMRINLEKIKEEDKLSENMYEISNINDIPTYAKKGIVILQIKDYSKKELCKDIVAQLDRDTKLYIKLPKICRGKDYKVISSLIEEIKDNIEGIVAENIYAIQFAEDNGLKVIGGAGLNMFNSRSSTVYGIINYVNSVELLPGEIKDGYVLNSDKIQVMTLTHCPVQLNTKCTCASCKYEKPFNYTTNSLSIQIVREKVGYCYFNMFLENKKMDNNLSKFSHNYFVI